MLFQQLLLYPGLRRIYLSIEWSLNDKNNVKIPLEQLLASEAHTTYEFIPDLLYHTSFPP